MLRRVIVYSLLGIGIVLAAYMLWCQRNNQHCFGPADAPLPFADETPVLELPLAGEAGGPLAEISAMAWYGEQLLLLPQYPQRFATAAEPDGALFVLRRSQVERAIAERGAQPLQPQRWAWRDAHVAAAQADSFEGYEALAIAGEQVFVTVELKAAARPSAGWLMRGHIDAAAQRITIDSSRKVLLPAQSTQPNSGYEALVMGPDRVWALFELNAGGAQAYAIGSRFDLRQRVQAPMATMAFRLTDATPLDAEGCFWAINYRWEGNDDAPLSDALMRRFGIGQTHRRYLGTVERLVSWCMANQALRLAPRPPVLLQLKPSPKEKQIGRNWEGIVRFGPQGVLLVTDKHPRSMLGFVPLPAVVESTSQLH